MMPENSRDAVEGVPTGLNGKPISVCLLISSLEFGGAERQVVEMVRSFDRRRIRPLVCSLSREVPLAASLPRDGEDLCIVEKRGRFDFTTVFRVATLLRQRRVEVVHAFLFDAEIVARLAAPLAGVSVVVASERNTDYVRPLLHKVALKATSSLFDVMVANSNAGKQFNMRTLGSRASQIEVVHNGVDVARFHPDPAAGQKFRQALGIPLQDPVIGMVASFKRQKGHDRFLRMAAEVRRSFRETWFLVIGEPLRDDLDTSSRYESEIKELAKSLSLGERCRFLGSQEDVTAVYNACDLTALLSRHEGTPNVVLESMACGVPVVTTDISDNRLIIRNGTNGYIVPRDDDGEAAAVHVKYLLSEPEARRAMGEAARACMCREFSLERAAQKLENIYANCLMRKDRRNTNRPHPKSLPSHLRGTATEDGREGRKPQ
jgi:glycosyltransferase involved in cell wall biosynthesis